MHHTENFPLLVILIASLTACVTPWLLRTLSRQKTLQKYLPDPIVTFVTIGVLIYTVCIWIVGPILVWVSTL